MKWRTLQSTFSLSWCVSYVIGIVHLWLVTYWDSCKKGGVHILKNSEVLKWWKVFIVTSSMGIVEFRDKGFVLDLKLLFTIVDCFSRRFSPKFLFLFLFFTVKLVYFISFLGSSYLVLFTFTPCMILTWYWYLFIINLINNLGLKLVNSINQDINFLTMVLGYDAATLLTKHATTSSLTKLYDWTLLALSSSSMHIFLICFR